jgi:hypothetical protein
MHKAFLALTLLSVPVSTGALAHSGTEQEEKARTRDVTKTFSLAKSGCCSASGIHGSAHKTR